MTCYCEISTAYSKENRLISSFKLKHTAQADNKLYRRRKKAKTLLCISRFRLQHPLLLLRPVPDHFRIIRSLKRRIIKLRSSELFYTKNKKPKGRQLPMNGACAFAKRREPSFLINQQSAAPQTI